MIICHCLGLTDSDLKIAAGKKPSCGVRMDSPTAGSRCGGCMPAVRELLLKAQPRRESRENARSEK